MRWCVLTFDFLVKSGDPPADWNPERVYFRRVSGVVVEVVGELRDWLKEKKKERGRNGSREKPSLWLVIIVSVSVDHSDPGIHVKIAPRPFSFVKASLVRSVATATATATVVAAATPAFFSNALYFCKIRFPFSVFS